MREDGAGRDPRRAAGRAGADRSSASGSARGADGTRAGTVHAVGRVVRSGIGRRRWQTAILAVTALVSVAAAVLGIGLLVASDAPFDRAFSDRHGAHLRVEFDGTAVTESGLAATAGLDAVTASSGPFPVATVTLRLDPDEHAAEPLPPGGADLGLRTVVGRADPSGPVDEVAVTAGRWARATGEIVLDAEDAGPVGLGDHLLAPSPRGTVTLTVVGLARSVTHTADAWAVPTTVAALTRSGPPPDYQMLYRLADAGTRQQVSDGEAAIAAALPDGAVLGSQSYLAIRQNLTANAAAFAPFVIAFGVIAVVMSVLVVGIVVGGTIGAAARRIGILKAIGFTPRQIARSYLLQTLLPTGAGMVLGAAGGVAAAQPVLAEIDQTYGSSDAGIPVWVVAAVLLGSVLLVAGAALVPALRLAARRTVEVWRIGRRTSAGGHAHRAQRLLAGVHLPPALRLGLGSPFRRPARSAAMATTVFCGAVCLTFAVGLMVSLTGVQHGRDPLSGAAVQVGPRWDFSPGGGATPVLSDPARVLDAVRAIPGTHAVAGLSETEATVSGLAGATTVVGISGDSSFTAHEMVSGHWLTGGVDEVVLPTRALRASGAQVGDRLTLTSPAGSTTATVVGEVFDLTHDGLRVYADASVLRDLGAASRPQTLLLEPDPGTDLNAYLDAADRAVSSLGGEALAADDGSSSVLVVMNAVAMLLAVMLLVVAGIGVLNTVLLETRERARDIGVLKSLGMTPRQTVVMVLASVSGTGLAAGALGVPVGVLLHHAIVPIMGGSAGAVLTPGQVDVYGAPTIAALAVGGVVIAALGAMVPAVRAARSSSVAALRSE